MKTYWTQTRANGQPIAPYKFCYVTDLEDGTHPIYTYGNTQEEVFDKIARQNGNAQLAMAARKTAAAATSSTAVPPTPPAPRTKLTGDQVMRATQDLTDPAKAPGAVASLVQDATGVDLQQMAQQNFARMAMDWQQANPEFYAHPGNKQLLANAAMKYAGSLAAVTPEILTYCYQQLNASGMLFERPASFEDNPNFPQPQAEPAPGESQGSRATDRPRGTKFSTGTRSSSFGGRNPSSTRTLKYTAADIRNMPESKARALIESNDKDYADACEYYFGASATA